MAGIVYAHDLSIADRSVLKNLENDILRHSDEKNTQDADADSDTNGSSTSSQVGSEASGAFKCREAGLAKPDSASPSGIVLSHHHP